jgi:hypothetical protein
MRNRDLRLLALCVCFFGCVPNVEDTDSLVVKPRVLAVRALPAEAAPRDMISYEALYADGSGTLTEGPLDWAFCIARPPLADLGPIDTTCLNATGDSLAPVGEGLQTMGTLPEDACRRFGPDRPAPVGDEPAGRPADPDPTGGFYQPVRVLDSELRDFTLFESRIMCALAGVTQNQFVEFNTRYRPNQNPAVDVLEVGEQTVSPLGEVAALPVKPGQRLALRLSWSDCSAGNDCGDGICGDNETRKDCPDDCTEQKGCTGSEYFAYFDRVTRNIVLHRETLRVSWFATAGRFDEARTGRLAGEAEATHSDNHWTAPDKPSDVTLWTVLRDDRGGVSWQSYAIAVQP